MKNNTNPLYLMEMQPPPDFYGHGGWTPDPVVTTPAAPVTPVATTQPIAQPKPVSNNPWNSLSFGAQLYAGSMATGLTSKITKDLALTYKIMKKYPEPMLLKQRLMQIDNRKCRILAAKLKPDTTRGEYKALIRKYICKGNMWRYFLHTVAGPVTTLWNAKNTISNSLNTADDDIGSNI